MIHEPVTARMIARRSGVGQPAVHNWIARHPDFPQPVVDIPRGRIWEWADVEDWLANRAALTYLEEHQPAWVAETIDLAHEAGEAP